MRVVLALAVVGLAALAGVAQAQYTQNTPAGYRANDRVANVDPCTGITVQDWLDVPADRYTQDSRFDDSVAPDYASIWNGRDNEFLFPNGFRKGMVYPNNFPPFCFNVANTRNKQVQVMLETVDPQVQLCIKDVTVNLRSQGGLDRCFTDQEKACFSAQTNTGNLRLMVYSPTGTGDQAAAEFWYRVRVSEATWDISAAAKADSARSTLEMWCAMQNQNTLLTRFPSDLRSPVVAANVQRVATVTEASSASTAAVSVASVLMCAFAAAFMRFL